MPILRWFRMVNLNALLVDELTRVRIGIRGAIAFRNSTSYWERRYRRGGNSGDGSRGRLAAYKSQFINNFVEVHSIQSAVEFGCGDGYQAEMFDIRDCCVGR